MSTSRLGMVMPPNSNGSRKPQGSGVASIGCLSSASITVIAGVNGLVGTDVVGVSAVSVITDGVASRGVGSMNTRDAVAAICPLSIEIVSDPSQRAIRKMVSPFSTGAAPSVADVPVNIAKSFDAALLLKSSSLAAQSCRERRLFAARCPIAAPSRMHAGIPIPRYAAPVTNTPDGSAASTVSTQRAWCGRYWANAPGQRLIRVSRGVNRTPS